MVGAAVTSMEAISAWGWGLRSVAPPERALGAQVGGVVEPALDLGLPVWPAGRLADQAGGAPADHHVAHATSSSPPPPAPRPAGFGPGVLVEPDPQLGDVGPGRFLRARRIARSHGRVHPLVLVHREAGAVGAPPQMEQGQVRFALEAV